MTNLKQRFIGELVTKWLPDGRGMEVQEDFAYVDSNGFTWHCFSMDQIDGASIPRFAWATTGSPYVGAYRRAAALHDTAYSHQQGTRDACDAMFLEAMAYDGVGFFKRWKMWAAVRLFGGKVFAEHYRRHHDCPDHPTPPQQP